MGRTIAMDIYQTIGDHLWMYVVALLLLPVALVVFHSLGAPYDAGLFLWSVGVLTFFIYFYFRDYILLLS